MATRQIRDMEDWKRIVEENIGLAGYVLSRLQSLKLDEAEKVSAANFGLIKAARAFDTDRGIKFATYAYRVIENEVLMAYRKESRHSCVRSLDAEVKEFDIELSEMISTGIDTTYDEVLYITCLQGIDDFRKGLKETEKIIFEKRLLHPEWTQAKIAKIVGVSQSYLSRAERKIRKKLLKTVF